MSDLDELIQQSNSFEENNKTEIGVEAGDILCTPQKTDDENEEEKECGGIESADEGEAIPSREENSSSSSTTNKCSGGGGQNLSISTSSFGAAESSPSTICPLNSSPSPMNPTSFPSSSPLSKSIEENIIESTSSAGVEHSLPAGTDEGVTTITETEETTTPSEFSDFSLLNTEPMLPSNNSSQSSRLVQRQKLLDGREKERQRLLLKEKEKGLMPPLERINQIQFIQLWKTFYDLVGGSIPPDCDAQPAEEDAQLFHSLAFAGTLLLQLGEANRTHREEVERQIVEALGEEAKETMMMAAAATIDGQNIKNTEKSNKKVGDLNSCINDGEWLLSLQQIVATVLAQPPLCAFFERKYSLNRQMPQTPQNDQTEK